VSSFGLVEHLSRRTFAIDAVLRDHAAPQVVVLGAGLDARAHRMVELAEADVFEVDHPSTQRYKRRRAADLSVHARSLTYVPVDFERDDLAQRLAESGHDVAKPTMWLWEGVTMYLTRDAVRATLAIMAARSAPSSTIALTYGTRELASRSLVMGPLRPFVKPAFALLGEPLRYLPSPAAIAALVTEQGFAVERDSGALSGIAEHLLVATR
jgi:methyltransferase (TIGR00027 family)